MPEFPNSPLIRPIVVNEADPGSNFGSGVVWIKISTREQRLRNQTNTGWDSISGGTPGGNNTEIQFNNAGSFGGDANLTWVPASGLTASGGKYIKALGSANSLEMAGATATNPVTLTATGADTDIIVKLRPKGKGFLQLGPDTNGIAGYPSGGAMFEAVNSAASGGSYGGYVAITGGQPAGWQVAVTAGDVAAGTTLGVGGSASTTTGGTNNFSSVYGLSYLGISRLGVGRTTDIVYGALMEASNAGAGTVTDSYGMYGLVSAFAGTTVNAYGGAFQVTLSGGTVTNAYAVYAPEMSGASNNYYLWFNSDGVFRVKEDNTFNSVGQAIPALYNPQFTKYTPGAANYERIVQQWNSNVAEIGTEKGGTGTLRPIKLIGDRVIFSTYQEMAEITAPSAPAANGVRIYAQDNGSGKTQLMALFSSGAAQQIAIEP